jgi:DNA-binding LytR/AlgR family response regulator
LTIAGLAFALIVASCFAAVWGFGHRLLPSVAYVIQELISNWALLLFALTCLTAIAHGVRAHSLFMPPGVPAVVEQPMCRVLVTSRGRREWIAFADVDWVESQGNYVTMHAGARNHWVRQTLSRFEAQLDPERFVRIHRRTIVALDRISEILAEGNGDASVRLKDGSTLRASRQYRKRLRDRWLGFGKAASAAGTKR